MKITFLTHSVDNIGGTIRATMNTAAALIDLGHEVEIAAVFKRRTSPLFSIDPRVKLTWLIDRSRGARRPKAITTVRDRVLLRMRSRVYPVGDTRYDDFTALTDKRVAAFLAGCDADVIVGTRPGLNVYIARYAPSRAVTVAQEHLFYDHHKPELRQAMSDSYRKLDALVTVSEADAENYRHHMPHLTSKVSFIPNSIIPTPLPVSRGDNKLIVAAGRIENPKRFDMLLTAFAEVNRRHPDWKLRIYGHGKRIPKLGKIIEKRRLGNSVSLMGQRTPLDAEWVKGSIAAVTSKYESFGMTVVEAMNCGLPVVSTACHYGPPEIISDGTDGVLTPVDDVDAFSEALCRLIEDAPLRHRMSKAAVEKAKRYLPEEVAIHYVQLFNELIRSKERTPPRGTLVPAGAAPRWHGLATISASAGHTEAAPTPSTPRQVIADCSVAAFDDLSIMLPGVTTADRVELSDSKHESITLPLERGERGCRLRLDPAKLSRVPEGVWQLRLRGAPVPAGRIDSRNLLRPFDSLPTSVVIPFAEDGTLALRVWRREAYAEVGTVDWADDTISVAGRLWGADWADSQVSVMARFRKSPHLELNFHAELDETGNFTVAIPAGALAELRAGKADLWDLWLCDSAGERASIRLTKFFDDIAARKTTQRFAAVTCGAERKGKVRPYFTVDNELSIKVTEPAPPAG